VRGLIVSDTAAEFAGIKAMHAAAAVRVDMKDGHPRVHGPLPRAADSMGAHHCAPLR
jgi:hypothetical protein